MIERLGPFLSWLGLQLQVSCVCNHVWRGRSGTRRTDANLLAMFRPCPTLLLSDHARFRLLHNDLQRQIVARAA